MTLSSFVERLGSIIETLQRINISFGTNKACLDPKDEFLTDYLIDTLQQSVAKLLTIKVNIGEPVTQKVAPPTESSQQPITDDLSFADDNDDSSSTNKQQHSSDSYIIKTEISHDCDRTVQSVSDTPQTIAKSTKSQKRTDVFKGSSSGNAEQVFMSGHPVDIEEDVDITVKLEVHEISDAAGEADDAAGCKTEHIRGNADFMEEDEPDTGGVHDDCDSDPDTRKGETQVNKKPHKISTPKTTTPQTSSSGTVKEKSKPINVCDSCGKQYKYIHSLIEHRRKFHDDNPRYTCKTCSQTFMSKTLHRSHFLTHINEKQYVCDDCGSKFTTKCSLEKHGKAAHSTEVFRCTECPKTFKWRFSLKQHTEAEHECCVHVCPICNITFKHMNNLKRHIKNKHKEMK